MAWMAHLEAGPVGGPDPLPHGPFGDHVGSEEAEGLGIVGVRLEEEGRGRAERPVGEALQPAEAEEGVPEAGLELHPEDLVDPRDREVEIDARRQLAFAEEVLVDVEPGLAGHVVNGRDAFLGRVAEGGFDRPPGQRQAPGRG